MPRTDHGLTIDETRQCEATTKAGRQCLNHPIQGESKCPYHAGKTRRTFTGWLSKDGPNAPISVFADQLQTFQIRIESSQVLFEGEIKASNASNATTKALRQIRGPKLNVGRDAVIAIKRIG